MRSILIMVAANIRVRKAQSVLIFTTILIAALLLAAAIGIMNNLRGPFETMFTAQNGSHLLMQFWRGNSPDIDEAIAWWRGQEQIESVQSFPYYWMKEQITHGGQQRTMGDLIIVQHPGVNLTQDILLIVAGESKTAPAPGELWIPTGYAHSWGIVPGDSMEFPVNGETKNFTVSAIVVDPQYSSGVMNPVRVWTGQGLFAPETPEQLLALRCRDATCHRELWLDYEKYLGHPVPGFILDYDTLKQGYSEIEGLAGAILLLFSGIIVVVALAAIAFTIANGVILDYKTIGILIAQGFSPKSIRWIYALQFLSLGTAAVPLGALLSQPLVRALMAQTLSSLGLVSLDYSALPILVTVAAMLPLILVTSLTSARRAGRVAPAVAVRNSGPAAAGVKTKWDMTQSRGLPIPLLLGLKMALVRKRHSVFSLAAAAILAFALVFSFNTFHSVNAIGSNFAFWGFEAADVFVVRPANTEIGTHSELVAPLLADPRTKAVIPTGYLLASVPARDGNPSSTVVAFVYDGDMSAVGVVNLAGRNPVCSNEVSLTATTAREAGKRVGDLVDLFVQGETDTYLVTGIYQSVNSGGRGFRIQEAAVRKIEPEFRLEIYSVVLQKGEDRNRYVEDVQKLFPGDFTVKTADDSGISLTSIIAGTAAVSLTLAIVFAAIAFIIVFNLTLINIYSEKKDFGIYKALGVTPFQARLSLAAKAGVLALVGAALGVPLSLYITPKALSLLVADIGLVKFPFIPTVWGTLAALPLSILVAVLSAWSPTGKILKISPRSLIAE